MLKAFRGSDKPPAVVIRTWYVPAARFDGRGLHGMQGPEVPLGTVSLSRFALSFRVSLFSMFSFPCQVRIRDRLTGALPLASYLERMNTEHYALSRHLVASR